jgi:glycosyltransferase involved in cell wall biosynthesis
MHAQRKSGRRDLGVQIALCEKPLHQTGLSPRLPTSYAMTPRISVVMPVRDGARWLSQAIESVRTQTLGDFELVIIDDGSTDDCQHIIMAAARNDRRIRPIRQERLGLVAALNRGLAESRGELIARLDADDVAHPSRLQRQSEYLDRHAEIGLLGTWAEKIDEGWGSKGLLKPPTGPKELAKLLDRRNPFLHSSTMVRMAVLQKVGFYRSAFDGAEDYDLWIRISESASLAILPEYLLRYRLHSASVTHRSRVRQLFSARLAQRSATVRRVDGRDPISELTAAPNWWNAESLNSSHFGDMARLYRFLDLADPHNISDDSGDTLNPRAISDTKIVLNHDERRLAQLALINLLQRAAKLQKAKRVVLLWHLLRLHPIRAAQFGYKALRAVGGTQRA